MTQLKTEAFFFLSLPLPLPLGCRQKLWNGSRSQLRLVGMVFTSSSSLSPSVSLWFSPKLSNPSLHACISVSVGQVQNKPKLLGLNQAIYMWKWAWQLNGNICSAKKHKLRSQIIVLVSEQVRWLVCCGGAEKVKRNCVFKKNTPKKSWIILSNQGFCPASVHSALFL